MRYSRYPTPDEMLQPLPREVSAAKCIESADAYYLLTAGESSSLTISHLLGVVYAAYFINETIEGEWPDELFRVAEAALRERAVSGERSGKFDIPAALQVEIQRVLSLYVHHLASVPIFIHVEAEKRVAAFLSSGLSSPIPQKPKQQPMH
ncbi:hypothetical protein [Burkholderia multivorans]|uniref:hypothetical protein n=1 Tax=Burkholderia multivorans TaxID=87883 RepID=UPI0021BF7F00|nr:hypothetical protein [Burkholderia multivorans]